MEDWQEAFKIKDPLTLADVRRFERELRNVSLFMVHRKEDPLIVEDFDTWGKATVYLCAAIDAGLILSPEAKRDGDNYTIDGTDILEATLDDKSKRIWWYGGEATRVFREATTVPFLSSRR